MNLHPSFDDWINRNTTVSSGPAMLTINAWDRCNLVCFMCSYGSGEKIEINIDIANLEPFLERARQVYFTGGEPFWMTEKVNRKAAAVFDAIVKGHPHLKINAFTNGVLFDEKASQLAVERFEGLRFSIDTADPEIYKNIRGKPLLGKAIENIKRLGEMKREKGLGRNDHPFIMFNSIVMKSTFDGMPEVARLLAELGGKRHVLLKLRGTYNPKDPELLKNEMFDMEDVSKDRFEKIKDELTSVYSETGLEVEDQSSLFCRGVLKKPEPDPDKSVCPQPWISGDIRPNGDVYFCCSSSTVLGNIGEQSFGEIWNGREARQARESFIHGEMKGCSQEGCPAAFNYFAVNGDSYIRGILSSIETSFTRPQEIDSIVLLRTARMHLSHLAARTLLKRFPNARLTIISNPGGAAACKKWGIASEVISMPDDFFTSENFTHWWTNEQNGDEYSLAASVYNSDGRNGYEGVEEIMRSIKAKYRIGMMPGGELVRF